MSQYWSPFENAATVAAREDRIKSLEQGGGIDAAAGKELKRLEAESHPECFTCRTRIESGKFYGPSHDPSPMCRSGKRKHCSCSTCC